LLGLGQLSLFRQIVAEAVPGRGARRAQIDRFPERFFGLFEPTHFFENPAETLPDRTRVRINRNRLLV